MAMPTKQKQNSIRALSVGHVTYDSYKEAVYPGGSAFYSAKTFQAFGAQTGIVTSIGEDFFDEGVLSGVKVWKKRSKRTTRFINKYEKDGTRNQWVEEMALPITRDIFKNEWESTDILFLAPVIGEVDLHEWIGTVDARITGLGLQGCLRETGMPCKNGVCNRVIPKSVHISKTLLKKLDVVFYSEEDLQAGGNKKLIEDILRFVPIVIMTLGNKGSILSHGNKIFKVSISKGNEVDPTGAGDTFASAFLFALAQGFSSFQAARLGAAAASIAIEGIGGTCLFRVAEAFKRMNSVTVS